MHESQALLALCRGELPASGASRADDWLSPGLVELAKRHQVAPLAAWELRSRARAGDERCAELLATAAGSDLQGAYLHQLGQNQAFAEDLARLEHALQAAGVDHVFFKGPWLAWEAYPDIGARPIGDMDLGVREENYAAAREALLSLGYRAEIESSPVAAEALHEAHYGRQQRFLAAGRPPVELHFRLINVGPPQAPEEWMWEQRRSIEVGGASIPVPGAEAMLLHVLLHANQHAFAVLRILHDVRFALAKEGDALDIDRLLARARSLRCSASLYFSLSLAEELAGASVDVSLLSGLRPPRLRRWGFERAWRLDAVRALSARRPRVEMEAPTYYLLEMGSPRDKLRYLAGIVRAAGGIPAVIRKGRRVLSAPGT